MPNDTRDADSGQFAEKHPDETFIRAIHDLDMPTTSEIAEHVGCPYRTAYGRLTRLSQDGRVTSREVGNSFVWMLADGETA